LLTKATWTAALSIWDGDGAVRLYEADSESGAILLERCEPGHTLDSHGDFEQIDEAAATIFHGLSRVPTDEELFPLLSDVMLRQAGLAQKRFVEAGARSIQH
jgi:streptomycin 6-kinase